MVCVDLWVEARGAFGSREGKFERIWEIDIRLVIEGKGTAPEVEPLCRV